MNGYQRPASLLERDYNFSMDELDFFRNIDNKTRQQQNSYWRTEYIIGIFQVSYPPHIYF